MFKYEITGLKELRQAFDSRLVDRAFDRALQVATMKARTGISKTVRQIYNVKASDVGRSVRLRKLQSEPGRLLLYAGAMIGLEKFSARAKTVRTARGRRLGVSVLVKKNERRKLVRGGFTAAKLGGGKPIFTRTGADRFPIEREFSLSIAHMVGNKHVLDNFEAHANEDAAKEFNRHLEYLMTMTSRPTA